MKTPPKQIIFDLDGTLVEFPLQFLISEAQRVMKLLDHPPVMPHIFTEYFAKFDFFGFVAEAEREAFLEKYWKEYRRCSYPNPIVFDGIYETLEHLQQQGCSLSIATARTGTSAKLIETLGEHTELLNYITHVVVREDESIDWRDKTVQIRRVCELSGIAPEDSMMIGDIPPDVTSAKQVGVSHAIAVMTGGLNRDVLEEVKPDLILEGVIELLAHWSGKDS